MDKTIIKFRYNNCQKKFSATSLLAGSANHETDFILITEPHLGRRCNAGFDRKWMVNHSGPASRAVIASKRDRSTKLSQFSSADAAFNHVKIQGDSFILGCVYFENGRMEADRWSYLLKELQTIDENVLLFADSNAHSSLWGYETSDSKGQIMEEVFSEAGLVVITPDYATTFKNSRGHESCIDVAIASPSMMYKLSKRIIDNKISLSDHTIWEIHYCKNNIASTPEAYKFKSANWEIIRKTLDQKLHKINTAWDNVGSTELDRYTDQFTSIIQEVIRKCIPKAKSSKQAMWWSPELTSEWNKPQNDQTVLEEAILKAKSDHWKQFIEANSSLGDAHLRRKLVSLGPHCSAQATVEKEDGSFTASSEETASYLLHQWFRFPAVDPTKQRFLGFYRQVLSKLESEAVERIEPFAIKEVLEVIASLRTDTCPGHDEIPTIFIQQTAEVLAPYLCDIFNISLGINHTSRIWKTGRVVLIPKASGGFRPITLLPVFIKVLEKLILHRLQVLDLTEHWIAAEQFAFRPGRSTNHALLNYATVAADYIKEKTPNCVVHLDIKGAFDNVWAPILLKRLEELRCPVYLRRWIADYLEHRRQFIRLEEGDVTINVQKSTPQGGSLSPFFWNIIIDPLLSLLKIKADTAQAYADDIVFSVTAESWTEVQRKTNQILEYVKHWTSEQRLVINPSKSSVIVYSACHRSPTVSVNYDKEELMQKSKIKYLGVIFQQSLSWHHHIAYIAGKASKALNYLSAIVKRNWGIQANFVASLYKAAVEPIITYGAVAWCNATISKARMKPLQRVQRLAARMAGCVGNQVCNEDLLNLVGFLPIDLRIQELAHVAWTKACYSEDNPCRITKYRENNSIPHFSSSQQLRVWDEVMKFSPNSIQLETSALKCKLMMNSPENLIKVNSPTHNQNHSAGVAYYTDGSKTLENTGAAYVKMIDGKEVESWSTSLDPSYSVYRAELCAIEAVLIDMEQSSHEAVKIYSDSQSALAALAKPSTEKWKEAIRSRLIGLGRKLDLQLLWVRGHAGIEGNESADGLAKIISYARPTTLPVPMSLAQVKSSIKFHVNDVWKERWRSRQMSWAYKWMPSCNRRMVCPPMENSLTNRFNSFVCNTLPLRSKLHQWSIISSPDCHFHPGFRETPRHVLFECSHHQVMRDNIVSCIRASSGESEFSCQAIVNNPMCVKILAEALSDHMDAMRPLNNSILVGLRDYRL